MRSQQLLGGSSPTGPVGEKNVSLPKPVPPLCSSETSRENPSIPTWARLERCEGLSRLAAPPRGRPRLPEVPGASWCQGNRPDHEGTLCLCGEAPKGLRGGGGPAGAGLHRPLLGKLEGCSKVHAGTSRLLGRGAGAAMLETTLLTQHRGQGTCR